MDQANSQRPLVLVVDDEALLRLNAIDFLQDAGFSTLEAGDGVEALALIEDHPDVGVVFTDINMPGEFDGLELASRVGQRWPEIRIIVASGKTVPSCGQLPPNGHFVSKPYTACCITDLVAERR